MQRIAIPFLLWGVVVGSQPVLAGVEFRPRQQGFQIDRPPLELTVSRPAPASAADPALVFVGRRFGEVFLLDYTPSSPSGLGRFRGLQVGAVSGRPVLGDLGGDGGLGDLVIPGADRGVFVGVDPIESSQRTSTGHAVGVAVGNWTGADAADLVVADARHGRLRVLAGKPGFPLYFDQVAAIETGDRPKHLLELDADGEGERDLLVVHRRGELGTRVILLLHSGPDAPFFRRAAEVSLAIDPDSVRIGDFDADGVDDVVALGDPSCTANSSFVVVRNRGDGSLAEPETSEIPCPFFIRSEFCPVGAMAVGDWNGDGRDDLAFFQRDPRPLSALTDALQLLVGNGQGFYFGPVLATPRSARAAAALDFDSDGEAEIVASFAAPAQILLYENQSFPGVRIPSCISGMQCLSGRCVAGLCCVHACAEDEGCAVADREGPCTPVQTRCTSDVECGDAGGVGFCVAGICCNERCDDGRCDVRGLRGTCYRGYDLGGECCSDGECVSGFCRDGRCCDSDCRDGTCGNVAGMCSPLAELSAPCLADDHCASGICDPLDEVCCADPCALGEECSNGFCQPAAPADCAGDCDGDGTVAVNELVLATAIALRRAPLSRCTKADGNRDGSIGIAELMRSTRAALLVCLPQR